MGRYGKKRSVIKDSAPKNPAGSTKKVVKSRESNNCWLCEEDGHDVAHIIPKSEAGRAKFKTYQELNLFRRGLKIHAPDNLTFLCKNCHHNFDKPIPMWIFLPEDINSFLETERQFQIDRKAAALAGMPLYRCPPTINPHRNYQRYQIRNQKAQATAIRNTKIKAWGGSPITAIAHSATIIYKNVKLIPAKSFGLPEDVFSTLRELLSLYRKPAPEILYRASKRQPPDDSEDEDAPPKKIQRLEIPGEPSLVDAAEIAPTSSPGVGGEDKPKEPLSARVANGQVVRRRTIPDFFSGSRTKQKRSR